MAVEYDDDLESLRKFNVAPDMSIDMNFRIDFGFGVMLKNPDRLLPRATVVAAWKETAIKLMGGE